VTRTITELKYGLEAGLGIAYRVARCLTPDAGRAEALILSSVELVCRDPDTRPLGADAGTRFLQLFLHACRSRSTLSGTSRPVPRRTTVPACTDPALENIAAAFATLPSVERLLTAVHLADRFSCEDLARITALPKACVVDRLRRGQRLLRMALRDQAAA